MGLSKLSTVTQNQGTAVSVQERRDPVVGLRKSQSGNRKVLVTVGAGVPAVGELYIVNPQAGGVLGD